MKLSHVKGKRIVGVRQNYMRTGFGRALDVHAIILEDGTELRPITIEEKEAAFYGTDFVVYRPPKATKRLVKP